MLVVSTMIVSPVSLLERSRRRYGYRSRQGTKFFDDLFMLIITILRSMLACVALLLSPNIQSCVSDVALFKNQPDGTLCEKKDFS